MTDIEKLEMEIAEKQAELKRLKEELNPTLKFRCIREPIEKEYGYIGISFDRITHHLRCMVFQISVLHKRRNGFSVLGAIREVKASEVSAENIKICNNLISEIAPILVKYMKYFIDINDVEE